MTEPSAIALQQPAEVALLEAGVSRVVAGAVSKAQIKNKKTLESTVRELQRRWFALV